MATRSDVPAIEGFLHRHFDTSMFLLGNLYCYGLEPSDDPHFMRMYFWQDTNGVRAVFGRTNSGFVMCQMPEPLGPALRAFATQLAGERVRGITGASAQVPHVLEALGLQHAPWKYQLDEPLYTLELCNLRCPPRGDTDLLRRPVTADRDLLARWIYDYEVETRVARPGRSQKLSAEVKADEALEDPNWRLLFRAARPVAMTTFTARTSDIAQVGGVFVPKPLRNHGLGRLVVALQLEEAARRGLERTLLFAANPAAARAYEALGFNRAGVYRISLLDRPATVRADI